MIEHSKFSSYLFERTFNMKEDHKNLTIWTSYHNENQIDKFKLKENENRYLFNTTNLGYSGKNINQLNRILCEGVCILYPYFNNLKSDIVGFDHYRREFDYKNINIEEINKGKIQVFSKRIPIHPQNTNKYTDIYNHFSFWVETECGFFDDFIEFLNIKYPQYLVPSTKTKIFYGFNNFVCSWNTYIKFCKFIWGYLNYIANKYKFNIYNENDWVEFIRKHFILYNRNNNVPSKFCWEMFFGKDNWVNIDYENDLDSFKYYRIFAFNLEYLLSFFAINEGVYYDETNKLYFCANGR